MHRYAYKSTVVALRCSNLADKIDSKSINVPNKSTQPAF